MKENRTALLIERNQINPTWNLHYKEHKKSQATPQ